MKKFVAVIAIAVLLVSFIGCKNQETLHLNTAEASKVVIHTGNMSKSVEITDGESIKFFSENINNMSFQQGESSENYNGFTYSVAWYDREENILESLLIMDKNTISYEGYFYNDEKVATFIDMGYIEELFTDVEK